MGLLASFTVVGEPVPQGSTRTWNKRDARTGEVTPAITHHNRERLMQWRTDIRWCIKQQAPHICKTLIEGPIAVRAIFYFNKPKSVKREFPTVAPDCDKLCRAVGDALEKVVIRNDAQIVRWDMWKLYTSGRSQLVVELWVPDVIELAQGNPFSERLPFAHGAP